MCVCTPNGVNQVEDCPSNVPVDRLINTDVVWDGTRVGVDTLTLTHYELWLPSVFGRITSSELQLLLWITIRLLYDEY